MILNPQHLKIFGENISIGDYATLICSSDKKIDISKAHVISVAFINDKIEGEYKRIFSKVIEPAKPKIIT